MKPNRLEKMQEREKTRETTANPVVVWSGRIAGLLLCGWLGHPGSVLAAPSPDPKSEISASSVGSSPDQSSSYSPPVRAPTEPPPFDPATPPAIAPADVKLSALPPAQPSARPVATESPDRGQPPRPNEGEPAEPVKPVEQVAPPPAAEAHTAAPAGDEGQTRPPSPDAGRAVPAGEPSAGFRPEPGAAPPARRSAPSSTPTPPATASGIVPPAPRAVIPESVAPTSRDTAPLDPVEQLR
jgi:hypothetical protein